MFKTHGVALHPGIGHSQGMLPRLHGHCWLQRDYERARAADFFPHNTRRARACTTATKSTRFCLTPHLGVNYHLSPLQVHGHMIAHPCQSNGHPTKQAKLCGFCGSHTGMCHTNIGLCTQVGTVWHLSGFTKADNAPPGMIQRPSPSIWASKNTTWLLRNQHYGPKCPVHHNKVGSLVVATKGKN